MSERTQLVAVGCSASKYDVEGAVAARNLYRGSYWSCKEEYATALSDDWRVLSAKYGIVQPDEQIESYELSAGDMSEGELDAWATDVRDGFAAWLRAVDGPADLDILVGRQYRDPLAERGVFDALREEFDVSIAFPFQEAEAAQGGIGYQMQWMIQRVKRADETTLDSFS